jgi:hypothetical protein
VNFDFTPEQEAQLDSELQKITSDRAAMRGHLTPGLAYDIGNFYRQYPDVDPSVLTPAVQAYNAGRWNEDQMTSFLDDLRKREYQRKLSEQKPKEKSWWERNVMSKFRTASRWTFAALNFVPQVITNIGSQAWQLGKGQGISADGFIISTELGTLLQNDEIAGDGFFVGGRAAELQAQRARDYRGTIDGQAFTFGRALARAVSQPGSDAYRLLSGLVDAGVALAVPAVPGMQAIRAGAKTAALNTGLRTLAGLTNYESAMIVTDKVASFLNSTTGRKLIKKLVDTKNVDEAMTILPTADLKYVTEISKIKDETAMKNFLSDTLGVSDANRGIGPKSIDDINISRWSELKQFVGRNSTVASMMASMPGRHVLLMGGDARQQLQSVRDVNNYLKILKTVPAKTRNEVVDRLAEALVKDDGSLRGVIKEFEGVVRTAFRGLDVSQNLEDALMGGIKNFKKVYDNALHGAVSGTGDAADFGIMFETIVDGKVVLAKQPLATAGLQSEMLRHAIMLPDARQTRRLVSQQAGSRLGWLTGKGGWINPDIRGELRMPLAAVEWVQNSIWRPLTLLTGGYVLRNMADSLFRQSVNRTTRTGIFHPFELINVAAYKKMTGDILAQTFKADDAEALIRRSQKELAEAAHGTIREARDPMTRHAKEHLTGAWKIVRRSQGDDIFMQGIAAELSLLASDDVARMVAAGKPVDEIIQSLIDEPGQQYIKSLQNRWANRTVVDQNGNQVVGTIDFLRSDGAVNRGNLEQFVSKYIAKRIEEVTGGSTKLKQIIGMYDPKDSRSILSGKIMQEDGTIQDAIRFDKNGHVDGFYEDNIYPTIKQVINDPNVTLKESYKVQESVDLVSRGKDPLRDQILESWDMGVDKFFSELYPKREAFLNRSPVFRQEYYNVIRNFIDELAPGEVRLMKEGLQKLAGEQGKVFNVDWLGNYVGDSKLAEKILAKADGSLISEGKITLTQLDAYAKGYALDETKKLFYDAAQKSNFADVLRIIAPFGSAWAEVTKKWVGLLASDPNTLRRFGTTIKGLQNADPDGDGKGFFYKDPQTGEYVFNYPLSEHLSPFIMGLGGAVTGGIIGGLPGALLGGGAGAGAGAVLENKLGGVMPTFVAPVKSLSMGFSVLPGIGPYAQFAASKIIGSKPERDWMRKILTPYGTPDMSKMILPSWGDKLIEAVIGDPESSRKLGDLVGDTMKALATTGKYNLSSPDGREKLEKDAIGKARVLLVLSAIGQFAGPTRPNVEFKVNTRQGDVMANELAKAFYEMQAVNYDGAVEEFLTTFGEDAFMYVAGKTKAVAGGLEATKEFGDWESQNKSLFSKYPEVAGYFAPVGSTFDYQAYVRQIETGKRNRLSPQELIAEAQFRVGSALYRKMRRTFGSSPTKEQEALLREARRRVGQQYPGFRDRSIDVNQAATRINKLYEAAKDKDLVGNPIASALQSYLRERDKALEVAKTRGLVGLSGKKAADLRGYLVRIGETLSDSFPEFEKLWSRILFNEVDIGD